MKMFSNVIMRCSESLLSVVEVAPSGSIISSTNYVIPFSKRLDDAPEEWFLALSQTLRKIPQKIRKKISLVTLPNSAVFVKHLQIPKITDKGTEAAFRFESESGFADNLDDWYLHIYHPHNHSQHAFTIAILKAFGDRFVDVLLRHKVQFSFICPEVLLNLAAVRHAMPDSSDSMLLHIDKPSSYLVCFGSGVEYLRVLPTSAGDLNATIADLQKTSCEVADNLQLEFLRGIEGDNHTFMMYYVKQFTQKLRQEIKKSELFYCRTFEQNPIGRIILSGDRCQLYQHGNLEDSLEIIDSSDWLKQYVGEGVTLDDEINRNLAVFVGAYFCIKNNQSEILHLFSATFSDQMQFQRQNFGYLLVVTILTLLFLMGLKVLKNDVRNLETQRAALEAKLLETDIDVSRYEEVAKNEALLKNFISNVKLAFFSQESWISFFSALHARLELLDTAWIETLNWSDDANGLDAYTITMSGKMLLLNKQSIQKARKNIESFIASLNGIKELESVENVKLSMQNDNILTFECDLKLNKQLTTVVR